MDQVVFYKKCDEVLSLLLKEKPVDLSEIRDISPEYYRAILQEFEEKNLIKKESFSCYLPTVDAKRIYDKRYYENKAEEKQKEIDRDALSERSVKSAEASAEAARSSAESAKEANIIARKSNKKARNSNIIAIFSALISFAVLCVSLYKCSSEKSLYDKKERTVSRIGKYAYMDGEKILHLKGNCSAVYKSHSSQPVKPQASYSVTYKNLDKVCSRCVSEQQMDTLIKFAKKNVGMINLYNAMKHDDYDVVPFDQFIKDMEDTNNVTTLYHTLIKDNYDIGTFEEFQASLFPEGK